MERNNNGAETMEARHAYARMVEVAKAAKVEQGDTKACLLDMAHDLFTVATAAERQDFRDFAETVADAEAALLGDFSYRV